MTKKTEQIRDDALNMDDLEAKAIMKREKLFMALANEIDEATKGMTFDGLEAYRGIVVEHFIKEIGKIAGKGRIWKTREAVEKDAAQSVKALAALYVEGMNEAREEFIDNGLKGDKTPFSLNKLLVEVMKDSI